VDKVLFRGPSPEKLQRIEKTVEQVEDRRFKSLVAFFDYPIRKSNRTIERENQNRGVGQVNPREPKFLANLCPEETSDFIPNPSSQSSLACYLLWPATILRLAHGTS